MFDQRLVLSALLMCTLVIGVSCSQNEAPPAETAAGDAGGTPAVPDPAAAAVAENAESETPAAGEVPDGAAAPSATADPEAAAASSLEGLSRKEMLKQASTGVVLLRAFDARGELQGFGSGCVVGEDLILTNYHVIESAVTAKALLRDEDSDAEEADADSAGFDVTGFIALDEENDLALLRVAGLPAELHRFTIAEPGSTEQFDEVFAIGHPEGLKFSTTRGFVNAVMSVQEMPEQLQYWISGDETQFIQTDAVIAGGSSGGPLLNVKGEVIGVNTLRFEETRFSFAVEAVHIRTLLDGASETAAALPVPGADVLVTEQVASLKDDFDREWLQLRRDAQQPEYQQNRAALISLLRKNNPIPVCVEQCLAIVKEKPGTPEAFDALKLAAEIVSDAQGQLSETAQLYLDQALTVAAADPAMSQSNRRVTESLIGVAHSAALEEYLWNVMNSSPDDSVRATAGVALLYAYAGGADSDYSADLREISALLEQQYTGVPVRGSAVEDYLEMIQSQAAGGIGTLAQDITGQDHEGKEFRLSDYRGKVVVLDFWADWCPHCRNMYEHEREMVERLKDKPFALLGVNCDEPGRANRIINSDTVTWRSWLDGPQGPIAEQWEISAFPTLFVLDQEGRIRYRDVRGEELDAAVEALLGGSQFRRPDDVVDAAAEWKYHPVSENEPVSGWQAAAFDDSGWAVGSGAFGYGRDELDTVIDVGAPGSRPTTILFRHTFDAPEGTTPDRLYLTLKYNDGIAISLNGRELYRSNLAPEAGLESPAVLRATQRESQDGLCIPVDGSLLTATGNCLAVELHQVSAYNADALFALTLGAELPPLSGESQSMADRLQVCRMIGQIGDGSDAFRDALKAYLDDESPVVRVGSAIAAVLNGDSLKSVDLKDPEMVRYAAQTALMLNLEAWRVVRRPELSESQYRHALQFAQAAMALRENLPKNIQGSLMGITNTLGVALYRAGDDEAAIEKLQESLAELKASPVDSAFLALAHHRLGHDDEAAKHRAEFERLMSDPEWKHHLAGIEAQMEIQLAFGDD